MMRLLLISGIFLLLLLTCAKSAEDKKDGANRQEIKYGKLVTDDKEKQEFVPKRVLQKWIGKLNLKLGKGRNKVQNVNNQRIADMVVVVPKPENVSNDSNEKHLAEGETQIENDAKQFEIWYKSEFKSNARLTDFANIGLSKYSLVPENKSDIKLVRRISDGTVWALKTVDIKYPMDQGKDKTHRFENEQRICNALHLCARKSKQIVHIEDTFVEINPETNKPSKRYILMELGYGDLGQLMDFVGGKLPEEAVRFYAAQILLGLEYLHSYGVLYLTTRDRNMLFDKDGNIKFIDFENSVVKGKPIEHQQMEHQQVDTATVKKEKILSSEFFKLGVLLNHLLSGKKLKTDKENGLKQIIDHPKLTNGLKDFIKKLMLGNDGKSVTMEELKRHHFFNYTEEHWQEISDLKVTPPYSPQLSEDNDQHLLLPPVKSSDGTPQFVRNW